MLLITLVSVVRVPVPVMLVVMLVLVVLVQRGDQRQCACCSASPPLGRLQRRSQMPHVLLTKQRIRR
jgi:hypothetical protein